MPTKDMPRPVTFKDSGNMYLPTRSGIRAGQQAASTTAALIPPEASGLVKRKQLILHTELGAGNVYYGMNANITPGHAALLPANTTISTVLETDEPVYIVSDANGNGNIVYWTEIPTY